ncbi:MAG: DUF4190 domain-containing protein [Acidimicrobiia bacterium]
MSSVPPGGWGPDDTGAVPVGPEPEPTGTAGAGSGGWGEEPRTEPFAVAALVWAIVSIILPLIGTIVALVLAARASDSIRRSGGTRSGTNLVNAARIIAGVVIALWAIGLIAYVATRDDSTSSNVAVPTQPTTLPSTTLPPSTTVSTRPLPTSTTSAPVTSTTHVQPTVTVVPPTTVPPTTVPPTTVAPTTVAPTTQAPTTTTAPPTTTTTNPERAQEARITDKLLNTGPPNQRIGPSNRGLPNDERVLVTYTVGKPLVIAWGINNGAPPLPTGTATCKSPPPPAVTTTATTTSSTSSSTTSSTTSSTSATSTTTTKPPASNATAQVARTEARKILNSLKADINDGKLDIAGVQLVGTYPIEGTNQGDVDVVQAFYTNADVLAAWPVSKAFIAPPAADVQCLNPAFA